MPGASRNLEFPRFSIGPCGTSPGGFSERAHAFRSHSPGNGGFRGRRGRPQGRPAGEHHEHSGARNRRCGTRRGIASGQRKPPKGAHQQHQRSSAEGGCARPWAQPLEYGSCYSCCNDCNTSCRNEILGLLMLMLISLLFKSSNSSLTCSLLRLLDGYSLG